MRCVVPLLTRFTTRRASSQLLWQYYWDTIEACVRPDAVVDALGEAGFGGVQCHKVFGIFSEYTARKSS
jgi:demethylmenaquinone methyltransferase/2-methoxy-6-polyprenyl-1,4-benzoquinol methylase